MAPDWVGRAEWGAGLGVGGLDKGLGFWKRVGDVPEQDTAVQR